MCYVYKFSSYDTCASFRTIKWQRQLYEKIKRSSKYAWIDFIHAYLLDLLIFSYSKQHTSRHVASMHMSLHVFSKGVGNRDIV